MTTNCIDLSQQKAAQIAGISCLCAMLVVIFANYALLNPLVIPGNAVETARNILAHERMFRLALTGFAIYSVLIVTLAAALYVVLKPVNHGLALAGALFRVVFSILWLFSTLNLLGALRLLGDLNYLHAFEPDRLQTLARLHIAAGFDDYYIGLPFFALASTVCSYLWIKSHYVPRPLAFFGLFSSAWCVLCAFIFLVFPNFDTFVNAYWFDSPMALFELAISLWLLFKGLRPPSLQSTAKPGLAKA
jgi:Domain of unknown function (DUF4386)